MGIKMSKLIAASKFVRRQRAKSRFTHYEGTWSMLEKMVTMNYNMGNVKPGYKDGIVLVTVPAEDFKMGGPFVEGCKITAEFKPRQEGEEPVLQITNHAPKVQCNYVEIVLYRHDVLQENDEASCDSPWEIISINGMLEKEDNQPIPPTTMARNFLHKKGGTKAEYTAEEFAESIWYWKNKER